MRRLIHSTRFLTCILAVLALLVFVPGSDLPAAPKGGNGKGGGGDDGVSGGDCPAGHDLSDTSPASLDLDTCGCPTTFGNPSCTKETSWTIEKTTNSGPFANPDGESFVFDIKVIEGPTGTFLTGDGQLVITNSGGIATNLSSILLTLEDKTPGSGDSPGPSGGNWTVLSSATQVESSLCEGTAVTCDGDWGNDEDAFLMLFDGLTNDEISKVGDIVIEPTQDNDGDGCKDEDPAYTGINDTALSCAIIDNDGDGLFDEDPIDGFDNDGDGAGMEGGGDCNDGIDNDLDLVADCLDPDCIAYCDEDDPDDDGDGFTDEDGECEDQVLVNFTFSFDITGLGIEGPGDGVVPSADDLRLNLMATFKAGGKRGGTCNADVDCDGTVDNGKKNNPDEGEGTVRTVKQRLEFDPIGCTEVCQTVNLDDPGAEADDTDCVSVDSSALSTEIDATGTEGTETVEMVDGTVSCICLDPALGAQDDLDAHAAAGDFDHALMTCQFNGNFGDPSYWDCTLSDAGDLNSTYDAWCIDTDNTLASGQTKDIELVSSLEDEALALVEFPENLDRMNWLINQNFAGQTSPGCDDTTYTRWDVQRAVWALVEDTNSTSGFGSWSPCRVEEIVEMACGVDYPSNCTASNCVVGQECPITDDIEGYTPDCSESLGVILNPLGNTSSGTPAAFQINFAQILLIDILGECEDCDCSTNVTDTAFLTCEDDDLIDDENNSATFSVSCSGDNQSLVGDFCSQTQGGWGTDQCNGNNTACLRDANFDAAFPNGLNFGDSDGPDGGDTDWAVLLELSSNVADFLPAGGTPDALGFDMINPLSTQSGVFGGQLTAAKMNVRFDEIGARKDGEDQPFDPGTLGTLTFNEGCVAADLVGSSVNDVIAMADCAIQRSGIQLPEFCGVPSGVTLSDLSDALAATNENFVDCITDLDCLSLP